jgi:hypothetical protein
MYGSKLAYIFFINPYILQNYVTNIKTYKIFNYSRHGSAIIPSVTNPHELTKVIMSICCSCSLMFVLTGYFNISLGQGETSLLQNTNDTLIETEAESKTLSNTAEKTVISNILRSATRNQYNSTNEQYATVLAPRTDGSVYTGVITFTASEPVRIEIQHALNLNNMTFDKKQLQSMIKYINNQQISASSITPNYTNDSFSFSIPFTGKALEFSYTKPFVVMYTVNAVVDKFSDTHGNNDSTSKTRVESLEPPAGYQPSSGTLLTAAIPYLSDEILQELPFSELDAADLSAIIGKIPADKATLILGKIPAEKHQEILSKIPTDKRQEILNME